MSTNGDDHDAYLAKVDEEVEQLDLMAADCLTAHGLFREVIDEKNLDGDHVISTMARLHLEAGALLESASARLSVIRDLQAEYPPGDPRLRT